MVRTHARTCSGGDSGATSGSGGDLLHFHLFIVGQTDNRDSAPSVPLPSTAAPVQRITSVPTAPHSPGRPPVIVHRHQRGTRVSIAHLASVHRRKAKTQTNERASTSYPRTQMSHVPPLPKSASTRGGIPGLTNGSTYVASTAPPRRRMHGPPSSAALLVCPPAHLPAHLLSPHVIASR